MTASSTLSAAATRRLLDRTDLTDPRHGHHAIQDIVQEIGRALDRPPTTVRHHHGQPVVTVSDNYDRLGYAPDSAARAARYTHYLSAELMLRSHTSAVVPTALERMAAEGAVDRTLVCPGMVYRRDVIDRQHVGEPHQLDVWRVSTDAARPLDEADLDDLIGSIVAAALPGRRWRAVPAVHPYTLAGRQIDVADGDAWVEVGECGLAHPAVLAGAGLPGTASGLASGWGLDRLLMLRKGIDDIRLLRSTDPRVAAQLHDLEPYVPVSSMPPAIRDLSVAMDDDPDLELLGDRVRGALGEHASDVESVEVLAVTPGEALPPPARERLGLRPDQVNVLVRVVLRSLDRTLTAAEANRLRDAIYAELHAGTVHHWASQEPPPSHARTPRAELG
jgi:phenylalanyl-tRNA synthetase alpha chain